VVVDGETLRLVINFAALDATESLLHPRNYADILDELGSGAAPKSLEAKVVWGLLREHHPALGLDEATSLIFGETGIMVGVAVSKLLEAAFPEADPKAKAKGKNPPKRRGASKTS
jgi:hypothetical protein